MLKPTIIQKASDYATLVIQEQLSTDFVYHDLEHTMSVHQYCIELALHEGLDKTEQEILALAAFFHDLGYLHSYKEHELHSKIIAAEFLQQHNYPSDKTDKVIACIHATIVETVPQNKSEEIIKDADLASLGAEDFDRYSQNLRYEWKAFCNEGYSDKEWYQINHDFLEKHIYFTKTANKWFGIGKQVNLEKMKRLI